MANVIMMENAGKYTFKLPENLTSGEYLVSRIGFLI
jgi:cellulase